MYIIPLILFIIVFSNVHARNIPQQDMIYRASEGNNVNQTLQKSLKFSILHDALKSALKEAMQTKQMISNLYFPLSAADRREAMALDDCKELLEFSISEIAWSLSEMSKIRDGISEVSSRDNLKAWLSAALGNQDTCLEGFDGTDRRFERLIKKGVMKVTRAVGNVLTIYTQLYRSHSKPDMNNSAEFPIWIEEGDKEFFRLHRVHVDVVVASDGSGQYTTVSGAILGAPSYSKRRYVIYVKTGIYNENVDLKRKKTNIVLVGDGIGKTIISGDRNFVQGWTTFRTATIAVSGKGFIARDMTFRNTAGPQRYQAVALRVDSDQSAFYRCSIEGYQDTLYAHSLRHFFRECHVYGTVDFIFGNGATILQNCDIFTRRPLPSQKCTVTAQGRKEPHQATGFSIQSSRLYATEPTFLGRPWKFYSRTVFMNTYMSSMVQPRGWLEWYGDFALSTLYYGEYKNYGPGASLSGRVTWPGYHVIQDIMVAKHFTVRHFIGGMSWLPFTGVKFSADI